MPYDKDSSDRTVLIALRQVIAARFDEEELRTLCFDLGVDYDSLRGEGKENKARELLATMERRGRVLSLIENGRRLRPDILWPEIAQGAPAAAPGKSFSPEMVQEYLPFHLYKDLTLAPTPEITALATEHLGALLRTVQTYCSAPVLLEAQCPSKPQGQWHEATLLFADISGFTAMSEQLNARGRAGAEEITHIVNGYFTAMVDVLHRNGGSLLKFGGDALLGMFVGEAQETARYAVQAALDMQRAMFQFADIDTMAGRFRLRMKVGVHTGQVFAAHVGTRTQMEYWLVGSTVNHTALAEEAAAEGGQVVASESTRQHLTSWSDLKPLRGQPVFYVLPMTQGYRQLPDRPAPRASFLQDMPELARRLDTLRPYLPKGLLPRLVHNPRSLRVEGEHRLVAVLFINVDGLSELAEALQAQPEAIAETMQDYYVTVQTIVEQRGGTVNKTDLYSTGDKLLAIFGAPVAHEDDIDQAARAALELQAALEQVNQRLAERCPMVSVRLRQRIGLSTGHVFSGNVGAQVRQEYTIMGDEVNLAARLMSKAHWGAVWVTSHVFYWLEKFGSFEALGDVEFKGKQDPVAVYRLLQMGETYRPKPVFVNRDEARSMLYERLGHLVHGEGQIVSLSGEAGIGKSRLLEEIRSSAEGNVLWLKGHCCEQSETYYLWASLLRAYWGLADTDERGTQLRLLMRKIESLFGQGQVRERCPFLAIVMGLPLIDEWKEIARSAGEYLPARLAREVTSVLERLTQYQPVAVVCEDLHWIDAGSVEILLAVMELLEYAPIMVCLTLRPGQETVYERVTGAITGRFQAWHTALALKPLDVEHGNQVAAAVLGQTATPDLQQHILERSDGNPLFIVEMSRAAVTMPGAPVPDTVRKMVEGRLDALSEGPRRAIKAAAVVGSWFSLGELICALEESERKVRQDLAELRRMQLVEVAGNDYRFFHPLFQEVIHDLQDTATRRTFHRRLGAYWAELGDAPRAAQHYFAGELWAEALAYGEQGADLHREAYGYREAIRLYEQALQAADKAGDKEAPLRLYHQIGLAHFHAGHYEQAVLAHQRELALLAVSVDQPADYRQAEARYALGCAYDRWGKYDLALNELDQGLRLAGSDDSVVRACLLRARCSVLINVGELAAAEQDGLQAAQIARQVGAELEEAYACNNLGATCSALGDYERALAYHRCALDIRQRLGVAYETAQSLVNVGTGLCRLGYLDEAEPYYREALDTQQHISDRLGEGITYHNWAWLDMDCGRLDVAESRFVQALGLWEQIDHRKGVAFAHNDLGVLYIRQQRWDEALDCLEHSAQLYEAMGATTFLPENYVALAQVYLAMDRPQDALGAARKALEQARQNQDTRQEEAAARLLEEMEGVKRKRKTSKCSGLAQEQKGSGAKG